MTTMVEPTGDPKNKPATDPAAAPAVDASSLHAAVVQLGDAHRMFLEAAAVRHGIGTTDLDGLLLLSRDEPVTPKQLRARLRLSTGAITALTDQLDTAGLLTRLAHPTDRRSLFLILTPPGRDVVRDVLDRYEQIVSAVPGNLASARYLTELAAAVSRVFSEGEVVRDA